MDDLHTEFQRHLNDRYPEESQSQSILDRIGQLNAYIDRLLLAYRSATQHIRFLESEIKQLKLERHLLGVELSKFHQQRNQHGHDHRPSKNIEIEPPERW